MFFLHTDQFNLYEGIEFRWEILEIEEQNNSFSDYYELRYNLCIRTEYGIRDRLARF